MVQEEQEAIHLTLAPKIYFSWSGAAIDVTLAPTKINYNLNSMKKHLYFHLKREKKKLQV